MQNKDSFGLAAGDYRRFRPQYPEALFDYLAGLAPARDCALDAATGNGQAAVALAERFLRVEAFDTSAEQIAAAIPHPAVRYRVGSAEVCYTLRRAWTSSRQPRALTGSICRSSTQGSAASLGPARWSRSGVIRTAN